MVEFAEVILRAPLDPWQRWVVIHAGEMITDANGFWRPRFRQLILLVARQNGKTFLLEVLAAFWLFVQKLARILGTSNLLAHAQEAMESVHRMAMESPELEELLPSRGMRGLSRDNNKPGMRTASGCEYRVAAATGNAGRSMTIHRWICDETLKLHDWDTYKSANYAMRAVRDAQAWFIGSQGDDRSVLLNALHAQALPYAEGKEIDTDGEAVGLFEYSPPEGAETDDPEALAMANPNMNHDHDHGVFGLEAEAKAAKLAGGQAEAGFRTESMCIRVRNLDPAVDAQAWAAGARVFEMPKDRRAGVIDVSADMRRATLSVARQTPGGKVQLVLVKDWDGPDALKRMRAELFPLAKSVGMRQLGYLPIGPAAAIVPAMQQRNLSGMEIVAITGEVAALCMGFAEQVVAGDIEHLSEPLLNAQLGSIGKKWNMGRWIFARVANGEGHCDAAYSAAGAVHLARMMPAPVGPIRLVGPDDED